MQSVGERIDKRYVADIFVALRCRYNSRNRPVDLSVLRLPQRTIL
jgi:hypothetical protein